MTRVCNGLPSGSLMFVRLVPPASNVVRRVCLERSNTPVVPVCTAVCPVMSTYSSFAVSPRVSGALATPFVAGMMSFDNIVQSESPTVPLSWLPICVKSSSLMQLAPPSMSGSFVARVPVKSSVRLSPAAALDGPCSQRPLSL